MVETFADQNQLIFFTPNANILKLVDLRSGPVIHELELPVALKSVHPLTEEKYLLVTRPINDLDENQVCAK